MELIVSHLRVAGRQLSNIKYLLNLGAGIVRSGGGPAETVKKAVRLLRNEGVQGFKDRIAFFRSLRSSERSYQDWIELYDTLDSAACARIETEIEALPRCPKISILMPVYNPPLRFLHEAIQSIRQQLYPNWELCVADDASTHRKVKDALRNYAAQDPRIKCVCRTVNGHICAASNSALGLVSGEFHGAL